MIRVEDTRAAAVEAAARALLVGNIDRAAAVIRQGYPFAAVKKKHRSITFSQKMDIFKRDRFIDRYFGDRLINPGILRVLSEYMPHEFPYHPHGKMDECHISYWELMPSIDHAHPICLGGADDISNWVTSSMKHNMIKNNWTLDDIGWSVISVDAKEDWDGLSELFIQIVENDKHLLGVKYIADWYTATVRAYG